MRIVAVADTDSYVKWAAALLGAAPPEWDVRLRVLETPLAVSASQQRSALAGSGLRPAAVERVTPGELNRRLRDDPPDAVLLAARGPLVRVLAKQVASLTPRPVIVTGLPGISIPATRKAVLFRTQCDLFVLHSHREITAFARLAAEEGFAQTFALASLPFARRGAPGRGTDLVFAAQAVVPRERSERMRVARLLRDTAQADPTRRVVVKLRGVTGEHQTHTEADPYPDLLAALGDVPANLVVSTAPMARALDDAEGLVTVSSTAAIEALARGIPVIALDTFGVSPALINPVFVGSGLFGDEGEVIARRFRHPRASWLNANYLHDPTDDDWSDRIVELVTRRRAGLLPPAHAVRRPGGRLRDAWERKLVLGAHDTTVSGHIARAIGTPLRAAVRRIRSLARRRQHIVSAH
ncbi:DUF6716 putative glycosyltransferase [Microbacterium koreense]|uniref:DUF6716 putative glycosyltransferase n=1 Tax=Microbacterium koreense TaxID=323761 RepID=A0ABW2ZN71_9MICO